MVNDSNRMNRHNPFVQSPPGSRRSDGPYREYESDANATGGLPEPEVSVMCKYGAGGSDTRIGVPCDVPTLAKAENAIHPRRNIDEEILTLPPSSSPSSQGVLDARASGRGVVDRRVVVAIAVVAIAAFLYMRRKK